MLQNIIVEEAKKYYLFFNSREIIIYLKKSHKLLSIFLKNL
jgi:hypothetical protein